MGGLALLDLPDEGIEALAQLDASFPDNAPLGGNDRIRLLIGQIFALLPTERRAAIGRQFMLPRVAWPAAYVEAIEPRTLTTIQQTLNLGRQLAFDYRSNYDEDTAARRYIVAPYVLYFRDGHTYLDTTVLQAPPDREKLQLRAVQFRLDRIEVGSACMLYEPMPTECPAQSVYQLVYTLAPTIARNRDVAHWFPETTVTYHDDGSASISARATNLWQARQILMRYIEYCEVLEPPELVDLMRQTAARMAQVYSVTEDDQQ